MQEVKIRLRFTRECLGYAKRPLDAGRGVIYCMPRYRNRVMFLPSWWKDRLRFAAKVLNRHDKEVDKIHWDTIVDGHLTQWKRYLGGAKGKRERYALHECFRKDAIIGINAVLPSTLSIDDFVELLGIVGTYKGISPFQNDNDVYGTFEVLSVMSTIRNKDKSELPNESCSDPPLRNDDRYQP